MATNPQHTDEPHYYKALSLYKMGDYEGEIAEWDNLIQNHSGDTHYAQAFLEKATTQKYHLNSYISSAQTLLKFVEISPTSIEAAGYIFQAARTYEENDMLEEAAKTWERVIVEYPGDENAILAQFEAGICYYRLGQYQKAQITFQKNSLQSISPADIARAQLWAGKSLEKQYKNEEALSHFQQAAESDPTGYYSIRAQEILEGLSPFRGGGTIDLGINWEKERKDADDWMRERFSIPAEVDLASPGDLAQNVLYQRGTAFWELGMNAKAQSEFDSLRAELTADALNSYRLMNHMLDLGLYQTAILSARQVLDLTGLDQATFLDEAPKYFNHIRFGVYYRDTIVSAANGKEVDPLLIFSVVRQESFFEADIVSSADAIGLMQITPATGAEIAGEYSWPENYSSQDLTRPLVNVKLGTYYLTKWYKYFDNDMVAALAAYNGGPLATIGWKELAGEDPDLLLEVIRPSETRDYIRYIREFYEIYRTIYAARIQ
jgi:soluble lytic murein transglycosylase